MTVDKRAVYPPLDVLKPVAENVWIVDSGPLRVLGMPLPIRATVIRLHDGDLLLHSPTRFDDGLRREMEKLGRIRHLVAPNAVHWSFLKSWQQRCPDTLTWAAPGLRERRQVRKAGVRLDRELTDVPPADWAGEIMQVVVPGGANFREVALFHLATRTLVLTDLVQNFEPEKLPVLMRPWARLIGVTAPDGRAPVYLRLLVRRGRPKAAEAASRMVEWGPARVIFSHGAWFQRDGTAELRRSLRWLLRDARSIPRV
jgi:Domain of unknown function (DUF4336)